MIRVVVKILASKEKLVELMGLLSRLEMESRKEQGCLSYTLYQRAGEQERVFIFEEWASKEDLELHEATAHFTEIAPQLKGLTQEITIEKF
ncbi:MAG: putative quinol monooxygenase [Bacteroidales bacterium]